MSIRCISPFRRRAALASLALALLSPAAYVLVLTAMSFTPVGYVDSATIGCFMDLYRQASAARPELEQKDPENVLLARQSRVRLSADGEVLVGGPGVFRGYWRNEEATREAIAAGGEALLHIALCPDLTPQELRRRLAGGRIHPHVQRAVVPVNW